jgi:hypothetical protein
MTVFAVFHVKNPAAITAAMELYFSNDHIKVSDTVYFVAGRGMTAQDVSDKLGITEGGNGSAIVVTVTGYYGRASTNVWEWIAAKVNQQ